MPYQKPDWEKRIARRSDLSSQVVHLTRSAVKDGHDVGPVDVLIKILLDRRISASTASGFIVGDTPAACFQDAPIYAIAQNIDAERQYRDKYDKSKIRYVGVGLMFNKVTVYQRRGRPVFYEDTERAKSILPECEWWRIVRFDLNNVDDMVDWTHEREWRVPGDFCFQLDEATVVLPSKEAYEEFILKCEAHKQEANILHEIRGIVTLGSVFY